MLQTLYYATKNSAAEAWALDLRLQEVQVAHPDRAYTVNAGDIMLRHELANAKRAAEATAQDAASALMLILDYAIQRLRRDIAPTDTRTIGADLRPGVKLNEVIWALANQARHAHSWETRDDQALEALDEVRVFRAIAHDPRNLNTAREIICGLGVNSYIAFEEMLLVTAHDALAGTGYHLAMLSAASFRLDVDR